MKVKNAYKNSILYKINYP